VAWMFNGVRFVTFFWFSAFVLCALVLLCFRWSVRNMKDIERGRMESSVLSIVSNHILAITCFVGFAFRLLFVGLRSSWDRLTCPFR